MAEWFKAHAWKACVANPHRGFKSHSLRQSLGSSGDIAVQRASTSRRNRAMSAMELEDDRSTRKTLAHLAPFKTRPSDNRRRSEFALTGSLDLGPASFRNCGQPGTAGGTHRPFTLARRLGANRLALRGGADSLLRPVCFGSSDDSGATGSTKSPFLAERPAAHHRWLRHNTCLGRRASS